MSTGFTFGAKTTATPTFGTGSITFGTPATQPNQQFGFGNLASSTPSLFGTQSAPTTSTLGFKPGGFGAPSSTPSTGFGLGAPVSSTFGATTSTPGTGFTFGATAPASTGLAFGTPASSAPATGLTFGAPASSAPATGLSFGAPASSAPATGLSFGAPVSSGFGAPATTGLTFGTPASTGLGFGTPASTGLSFGTTSSAPSGFGLGTSTQSSGLPFGATTTTSAPTGGLSFGTTTSTVPTLGLSFGPPNTVAPNLSFGTTTTTPTTFSGLGFGLGGISTTSSATGLGLTATTTTQSVGLGGIASTQSKPGTTTTTQKEVPPREQLLPNEFLQTVEQFKNVVQEEKVRSSDVARCSVKEFRKVEGELDLLNHQFSQVENQLQNNRNLAEKLKFDTAKGLQHIEMAQRTQDTPPGLQYDNTAPLQFFLDLAEHFEREMQLLKVKIDNTEKFIKKCGEWTVLTSQDLALGMRRLHETFVALAGRMQAIHNQVETQKEIFLSIRKQAIKDNINPFEKTDKNTEAINTIMKNALKSSPPKLASGPTPFNNMALGANNLTLSAQQTQPPAYPTATTATSLGFGIGSTPTFGTSLSNSPMFKPTGFGTQPFQMNMSSNFQLQKPPTGNKRGKQ